MFDAESSQSDVTGCELELGMDIVSVLFTRQEVVKVIIIIKVLLHASICRHRLDNPEHK